MPRRPAVEAVEEPAEEGNGRTNLKVIGERVRAGREELAMTQLQLATQAGVDPSTVHRLEVGKQSPSIEKLVAIARVLGMSLDQLVG